MHNYSYPFPPPFFKPVRHYNYTPQQFSSHTQTQSKQKQIHIDTTFQTANNNTSNHSNAPNQNICNTEHSDNDESLFEIFGLKIYFDDLLLICILLFLYQEGIKDEYLFISLILLLLS